MASSPVSGHMWGLRSVMLPELRLAETKAWFSLMKGEKGGEANANVHLEMEGRRRRCGVMHYRVSGSHSLWGSDDITAQWRVGGEEGRGRRLMELKYTPATDDKETFTSVLLCGALWGFPHRTGTDEYVQGDSAVRLDRETGARESVPALCYQTCHPSARSVSRPCSSRLLVFVCRLSAGGQGKAGRRRHVGGVCLDWSPRECQIRRRR